MRKSNGGAGIRTLKSVRTPVFETGALPFCHPSEGSCSICLRGRKYGRGGI